MKLYKVTIITEAALLAKDDHDARTKAEQLRRDIVLDNNPFVNVYEMIGYPNGYTGKELVYGDDSGRTLDELVKEGYAPAHDSARAVLSQLLDTKKESDD